jgi:hypothetical protein
LELKLDFHSDEIDQLADDYAQLDVVSVEQLHTNIQALRGLGWSVGQVKALILKCPPLLEISFESFLSFFYNYGATPRVRALAKLTEACLLLLYTMPICYLHFEAPLDVLAFHLHPPVRAQIVFNRGQARRHF